MDKDKFSSLMALVTYDVISRIMKRYRLDEDKAMSLFHKSKLYSLLEKEETKVWYYSSEMLVELFDREMNGNLVFPDI